MSVVKKAILKRQKKQLKIKQRLFIYIGIPLLFLFCLWTLKFFFSINITSSMPIGLYRKLPVSDLKIGSYVGVCLNKYEANLAIKNQILIRNGQCPSGSELMIKEVIALPNDQVEITDKHLIVKHSGVARCYFAPRFNYVPNTNHEVLTFTDLGKFKSKGYWVYGFNNQSYSWDSRYFGELKKSDIQTILKPILVYKAHSPKG